MVSLNSLHDSAIRNLRTLENPCTIRLPQSTNFTQRVKPKIAERFKAHVDFPHNIGICKRILTFRVGLIVVAQLIQRPGLEQLADRQLPVPGSDRENCYLLRRSEVFELQNLQ